MICLHDDDYPKLLAKIPDPPARLWVRGKIDPAAPCIAIVGTRSSTRYGEQVARQLARDLAARGACIVSGLARGIDAAAHRGALEAGGQTIAVLGCGLDVVYPPEHGELAREVAAQGALVSEYPPDRSPGRYTFVQRNRIIAGLSAITVVVESPLDGGAMTTADFACEQGRTVGAVPGRIDQPSSAGCLQLLKEGAAIVTCADDLFAELGFATVAVDLNVGTVIAPIRSARGLASGEDERRVLAALAGGDHLSLDQIVERCGLLPARASAAVMMLELKGAISKRPDGCYEA
ncbi:MAG TPA: DNA-processing protein DprA [Opitutaceae bacterium]